MLWRRLWIITIVTSLAFIVPGIAIADTPKSATTPSDGLYISPVREYITASPNDPVTHALTVANHSKKTMVVTLSLQEFTVTDYSYDYQFKEPGQQWVHFAQNEIKLEAGKSQTVSYTLQPPATAEPGGHYLSIVITAALDGGAAQTRLQAAEMLYITVKGDLHQSTRIVDDRIPHLTFGDTPFTITARNTGNTHVFTYLYGQLEGLSAQPKSSEVAHLLMPGTVRSFSDAIPAPLLPGLYKAVYGYTTNAGQQAERSTWVLYIPVWSIAIGIGLIIGGAVLGRFLWRRRQTKRPY
jgi:uncharacterized membrane protein YjjB (DUF3815 family)